MDTRGILRPDEGLRHFRLTRPEASADLAPWVERHWVLEWELDEPFTQDVLAHPSVHLTVESERADVWGVQTRRYTRTLSGRGRVVGVKFRPGGFRGFWGRSVRELTDRAVPIDPVLADTVRAAEDPVAVLEDDLRSRLPVPDARLATVTEAIAAMDEHARVDDVARAVGLSTRSLQRLFREYVGVGPKWILQRRRLHEAVERGGDARSAHELGYADQAHLVRDFKAAVGVPPGRYTNSITEGNGSERQRRD